jgi:hypothetical protein
MRIVIATLFLLLACAHTHAQGKVKAARELAEFLIGKFGAKAGTVSKLAPRLEALAAKHGDDALLALRKGSPAAVELVEQAGVNGGKALRVLATHGLEAETKILARPAAMKAFVTHGDDAAVAIIKHPGVAENLIEKGGASAVQALTKLEPQAARKLAMLAEGEMAKHPEVMGVAAKHGEKAVEFMWKHRKELAVGTAGAAFIANPEPFLNGTSQLIAATGDSLVKPVAESVVKPAVEGVTYLITVVVFGSLGFLGAAGYAMYRTGLYKPAAKLALSRYFKK